MLDMLRTEFVQSIQGVSQGVIEALPRLLAAIVFIVIGWIFGTAVGRVVQQIVEAIKVDDWLRKAGVDRVLARAGYQMNSGKFLGWLAKLFFIVVMLIAAFDILGLSQVNSFLTQVLAYIPQVVVAAVIFFVASLASDILAGLVHGASRALGSRVSHFLDTMTRVAIWSFAVIMALSQLGIAAQYMYTLFAGLVAMFALAGGLAFGLGGKDAAKDLIEDIKTQIQERK
jgi:small-conductance mechanosensitive channel